MLCHLIIFNIELSIGYKIKIIKKLGAHVINYA